MFACVYANACVRCSRTHRRAHMCLIMMPVICSFFYYSGVSSSSVETMQSGVGDLLQNES